MDTWITIAAVFFYWPSLVSFGGVSLAFGYWLVKPLRLSTVRPPPRLQFRIGDIFALLLQMGTTGVVCNYGVKLGAVGNGVFQMLVIWVLLAWCWWMGVGWLSQSRVVDVRHRMLVLLVGVPMGFGGSLLCLLIGTWFVLTLFDGDSVRYKIEAGAGLLWCLLLLVWIGCAVRAISLQVVVSGRARVQGHNARHHR